MPPDMTGDLHSFAIARAKGSTVEAADGRRFTDLVTGFGSVSLGHCEPRVQAALASQMAEVWSCGRLPTVAEERAHTAIAEVLPPAIRLAGLYSTGMEAAEYAMRVAATHTGRQRFLGFARGMHGKSAMTGAMCWSNAPFRPANASILPCLPDVDEAQMLEAAERELRRGNAGAVFVEPIHASDGGHEPSGAFFRELAARCKQFGALLVFDEILTGLWRTGARFYFERLEIIPDVVLFAKSMGNGFPASAVAISRDIVPGAAALPGSTFSGNPLACAAVAATLDAMRALHIEARVPLIEDTVRRVAAGRPGVFGLRGRGMLWLLELDASCDPARVAEGLLRRGVLASVVGRRVRLLPAATIESSMLEEACAKVVEACEESR